MYTCELARTDHFRQSAAKSLATQQEKNTSARSIVYIMQFWKRKIGPSDRSSRRRLAAPGERALNSTSKRRPSVLINETISSDTHATVNLAQGRNAFGGRVTECPVEVNEERYGLFCVHDQPRDKANIVDIVAVHGLNGHFEKTWEAKTLSGQKVNWVKDFLPQQMPYARIMSFGYNSTVLFSKTAADIGTYAEQLLEDLISYRGLLMRRPIIFICHSLGGIVVKKVCVTSVVILYRNISDDA
jgi:hypothetical protein